MFCLTTIGVKTFNTKTEASQSTFSLTTNVRKNVITDDDGCRYKEPDQAFQNVVDDKVTVQVAKRLAAVLVLGVTLGSR